MSKKDYIFSVGYSASTSIMNSIAYPPNGARGPELSLSGIFAEENILKKCTAEGWICVSSKEVETNVPGIVLHEFKFRERE